MDGERGRRRATAGAIALGAVVLLASPLRLLWAHAGAPWWAPYAAWALVIAAGGWAVERWGRHVR